MKPALIKISFKQTIDATMDGTWEQSLVTASYEEFLLKSQAYNLERKYTTFQQIVANDGRANSLHYKCSFPLSPYINMLHNAIPGLTDNAGKNIRFEDYQFTLIESDTTTRYAHKFSLTYFTPELTLVDSINDYLLLAYGNKTEELFSTPPTAIENTFLLRILPDLSVLRYQAINTI